MSQANDYVILAGGCFWGVEELFRELPGVSHTEVGYTGGHLPNPTYEDICTGQTGHAEAIKVDFDNSVTSLKDVLHFFFKIHDPTTRNRQGNDIGSQYRSSIFIRNASQKEVSQQVIEEVTQLQRFTNPIVTELEEEKEFYSAEEFHQDYLQKNPGGYTCHFIRD